jgi:ribonuclease E/ribonuclease G
LSRRLVVEATGFGARGAVLEGGRLVDLVDADEVGGWVTDALFLAQVRGIEHRLNAAFLDIGEPAQAFLNAKDARHLDPGEERQSIGRLLQDGKRIVVQGVREPEADKGPRVTTDIKLFGFHLIHRPHGRLPDLGGPIRGREREALQQRAQSLFGLKGVTLRKLAAGVEDGVLLEELAMLEARWRAICAEADKGGRPRRLTGDEHALERLVRAVMDPELRRIEIADEGLLARCRRLVEGPLRPHGLEIVRLEPGAGAFEQTEVAGEMEMALAPEVRLRGGGRIIIEPTRACVAVDVDGEGRAALDVDIEAAIELARQVRLRNLGGTIVVDFVDLPTKAMRQRLEDALKRAFRGDPAPLQTYPMSPLGIVQISRARRGRSLEARLRRDCPVCDGSGRVRSLRAAAEQLVIGLRSGAPRRIRAAPDLADYLSGEAAAMWRSVGSGVPLDRDPGLDRGAFVLDGG